MGRGRDREVKREMRRRLEVRVGQDGEDPVGTNELSASVPAWSQGVEVGRSTKEFVSCTGVIGMMDKEQSLEDWEIGNW